MEIGVAASKPLCLLYGSEIDPVVCPVFKTGGWHLAVSPVGSTPTRFRHLFSMSTEGKVTLTDLLPTA